MAASDVLGTGWFAADEAHVSPGSTVVVVGDGAVRLMAILVAKQMGADRIIAMSRHVDRQALAREFGATDIVEERGEAGITNADKQIELLTAKDNELAQEQQRISARREYMQLKIQFRQSLASGDQ